MECEVCGRIYCPTHNDGWVWKDGDQRCFDCTPLDEIDIANMLINATPDLMNGDRKWRTVVRDVMGNLRFPKDYSQCVKAAYYLCLAAVWLQKGGPEVKTNESPSEQEKNTVLKGLYRFANDRGTLLGRPQTLDLVEFSTAVGRIKAALQPTLMEIHRKKRRRQNGDDDDYMTRFRDEMRKVRMEMIKKDDKGRLVNEYRYADLMAEMMQKIDCWLFNNEEWMVNQWKDSKMIYAEVTEEMVEGVKKHFSN